MMSLKKTIFGFSLLQFLVFPSYAQDVASKVSLEAEATLGASAPPNVPDPKSVTDSKPSQGVNSGITENGELIGDIKDINPDNVPDPKSPIETEIRDRLEFLKPDINVNKMDSLLFTKWEHDLIIDARRGLNSGLSSTEIVDTGPSVAEIALGGIVFKGSNDWTIWLNNTRVTPDAIPSQILDLKVFKEYIEIEWFDSSKNLIFPIRLRTHQRFNLDTRMFLPG